MFMSPPAPNPTPPKFCKRKSVYFCQLPFCQKIPKMTHNKKILQKCSQKQTGRHTQLSVLPKICFLCYCIYSFSTAQLSDFSQASKYFYSQIQFDLNLHKPSWLEIPLTSLEVPTGKAQMISTSSDYGWFISILPSTHVWIQLTCPKHTQRGEQQLQSKIRSRAHVQSET